MRVFLGEFEQLLLLALLHGTDEAYGVQIRQQIEDRTGRTVSPGAIYTSLDRLERRGLVSSRLGEATPARGGKRKRYYRIQPRGVRLLRDSQRALAAMTAGISSKLETS